MNISSMKTYEYKGDTKKIPLFDKAISVLTGKTLEEQADCLCLERSEDFEEFSYGKSECERSYSKAVPLKESYSVDGLILYNGIIVGVDINHRDVLLGRCIETYFAVDEDGTGSESVSVYHTLLFAEGI